MTIRADLHVHAKLLKAGSFDLGHFQATVERARDVGLSGIGLTEHMDAPDYWDILGELVRTYPYGEGRFSMGGGFHVLTGAELTVAGGGDVVLLGGIDALGSFDRSFARRPSLGRHPPLADIFDPAHDAGLIVIAAHPTRRGKSVLDSGRRHLGRFDALELNGKDVALRGVEDQVRRLASRYDLPVVGSSDAHVWPQVGIQSTALPLGELTQRGLRECILDRTIDTVAADRIESLVRISGAHKAIARRALVAGRTRRGAHARARRKLTGAPMLA